MTNTEHMSLVIGAVAGIGSAMVTAAAEANVGSPLIVPLVSAAIASAVSYGVMKASIKTTERDVSLIRSDLRDIYNLIRASDARIAHMEGRLERRREEYRHES